MWDIFVRARRSSEANDRHRGFASVNTGAWQTISFSTLTHRIERTSHVSGNHLSPFLNDQIHRDNYDRVYQ